MKPVLDRSVDSTLVGSEFTISKNSAKLFTMLGSFLYSNKELAVLNEICSNAVDAHAMVGKSHVPIDVYYPTRLSPNMVIRDYGPGLSEENVFKFLTTYGESNKTESNDFLGEYGIGSKSPAAVTDTWSVVSYHDGVKTLYQVVIATSGVPSLAKIHTSPTNETGLEVIIPVIPADIGKWDTASKGMFDFYKTPPRLHNSRCQISKFEYSVKVDGMFGILDRSSGQGVNRNPIVVCGIRPYELDFQKYLQAIPDKSKADDHKEIIYSLLGVHLFFEIGDIQADLSREKLQYSEHTITNLFNRIEALVNHIKNDIHNSLKPFKGDVVEYRIQASSLMKKYDFRYDDVMLRLIHKDMGIVDTEDLHYLKMMNYKQYHGTSDSLVWRKIRYITRYATNSVAMSVLGSGRNSSILVTTREYLNMPIRHIKDTMFFENDMGDSVGKLGHRVRHYALNAPKNQHILIFDSDLLQSLPSAITSRFVKVSNLPDPPKKTASSTSSNRVKSDLYRLKYGRWVKTTNVPDPSNSCWVKFDNAISPRFGDKAHMVNIVKDMNDVHLYAVKDEKNAPAGVKSIDQFALDHVKKYDPSLGVTIEKISHMLSSYDSVPGRLLRNSWKPFHSQLHGQFGNMIRMLVDTQQHHIDKYKNSKLSNVYWRERDQSIALYREVYKNKTVKEDPVIEKMRKVVIHLNDMYPLLKYVDMHPPADVLDAVNHYIKLVEENS